MDASSVAQLRALVGEVEGAVPPLPEGGRARTRGFVSSTGRSRWPVGAGTAGQVGSVASVGGMAGDVRIQQAQGFGRFGSGVRTQAETLRALGNRRHTPIHPVPPAEDPSLGDLKFSVGWLQAANDGAMQRLAQYATSAHRGLGGLAYTGDLIGLRLPGVDLAAREVLGRLVKEAEADAPAPPADMPGTDPRFVSLPVIP